MGLVAWLRGLEIASILVALARADSDSGWEEEWRRVCEYDVSSSGEAMCLRLKAADQQWKEASVQALAVVRSLGHEIRAAALRYGVDERAVAAVIVAERSLNVTPLDRMQDLLARTRVVVGGRVAGFGPPFSVGVGQLYLHTAVAVEPLAARIERRPRRGTVEIWQALQDPERAIHYVAAVLRQAQDAYRRAGFDVSGRPDLLATLYNLGQPDDRAARSRAAGRSPRVNYFGLFVTRALPRIEAALR
jgi:hypothetical protein